MCSTECTISNTKYYPIAKSVHMEIIEIFVQITSEIQTKLQLCLD